MTKEELEKEAEEWVIDNVCKDCSRYEKCKSKEHCTCKECSKEKWQDGAEFGYNEANEWHYVKDGDLPKEFDKPYLCKVNGHFEVGYFMAYKEQPWHFDEYYLDNEDVIAWCEIPTFKE